MVGIYCMHGENEKYILNYNQKAKGKIPLW
jgi:hypothetical protein